MQIFVKTRKILYTLFVCPPWQVVGRHVKQDAGLVEPLGTFSLKILT